MSNMSYCRFENTTSDLRDCVDALEYGDLPTSTTEIHAARRMAKLCKAYLAAYSDCRTEMDETLERNQNEFGGEDDDA